MNLEIDLNILGRQKRRQNERQKRRQNQRPSNPTFDGQKSKIFRIRSEPFDFEKSLFNDNDDELESVNMDHFWAGFLSSFRFV